MSGTTVGLKKAKQFNFGAETVAGTAVPATHMWLGPVQIQSDDTIVQPDYDQGILGDTTVEDPYVSSKGTTIVLGETMFSVEQFAYLLICSIKAVASGAALTPFLLDSFALPTDPSAINVIKTLTGEWTDGIQAYEAAYAFCEKWSVSADENSNGGTLKMGGTLRAKGRSATTITPAMAPLPLIAPLNIKMGTVKLDALGTAAGTHAATSNWLKSFKLDFDSGWIIDDSMSGGADIDFTRAIYNGMHGLKGSMVCLMDANSVTEIANARTPTGRILQLVVSGAGTRKFTANMPITYTKDPEWGNADRKGLHTVSLEFRAGYSRTSVAQGLSFPLNHSASTTMG